MKILVIGANGMLGNACMNYFSNTQNFEVIGSVRETSSINLFAPPIRKSIISGVDVTKEDLRENLFHKTLPDVVINCVGLVKQTKESSNAIQSILLNTLLPHQLSELCKNFDAKLIHVGTDCVFSGKKGSPYGETDLADAEDLYGKTKYLGEITGESNVLTLRTSIVGNELNGAKSLLEWFLSQRDVCQGYTRAIFTGVPTVILMAVIEDLLMNHPDLYGLFNIASTPISKYNLLKVSTIFNKKIQIIPNDQLVINRSLDGTKFRQATGFIAPPWEEMVERMHRDRMVNVQK
jgi:dTDP-4-dehydrorhamnose reductase